jgi:predicted PurR-regulated permease PerM
MERGRAFAWLTLLCCAAAAVALLPLWPSLVLAAWFALLTRPIVDRLEKPLRKRSRAALLVTALLLVVIVAPLVLASTALYAAAIDFAEKLSKSGDTRSMLTSLVNGSDHAAHPQPIWDTSRLAHLAQQYGGRAWSVAGKVVGATAAALIGVFVFLYGIFVFLVHGRAIGAWLEARAPFAPAASRRMFAAFEETGRGLLISMGLTALVQGAIATVAYLVLGVPSAVLLGLFTALAALIPASVRRSSGCRWRRASRSADARPRRS